MSTPLFNFGGIASGLDTSTIIQQLMQIERTPVVRFQQQQQGLRRVDDAWAQVTTRLSAVRTAVDALRRPEGLAQHVAVTSTNDAAVSVARTGTPATGSLTFTVERLAAAHQVAAGGTFAAADALVGAGGITLTAADGTELGTVETDETTTLADLATRINGLKAGPALGRQLLGRRHALRIGAVAIAGLALLPGLPKLPFLLMAAGLFFLGTRAAKADEPAHETSGQPTVALSPDDPEALIGRMRVEPLELHLAYDILDLIDAERGGDLLERVRSLRTQIALDLGVVMPFVRTRDDVSLPPATYRILLHGVEVARGTAPGDRVLALPAGDGSELRGIAVEETVEPVFGLQAYWIPGGARASAAATGATVVDRSAVVVTHLAEVVRASAGDLLSRQLVQQLVEGLRVDEPLLAAEVGTETLPVSLLHAILRGLLEERAPVRDLGRITEAVAARARETRSVEQLVAVARAAIGSAITSRVAPDRALAVLTLDPELESRLHEALRDIDGQLHLAADPERLGVIVDAVRSGLASTARGERPLAVVCGQMLRRPLRRTLAGAGAGVDVAVLAYPELPAHLELTQIGVIGHVPVDA